MEFTIPEQLLLVIVSSIVLLTALSSRIIHDTRMINQTRKLNRRLIKAGRARLKTGVSVIIELSKKADSITPLLDHLGSHSYSKLEVIVVIKQTAGKNARPTLARYAETHPKLKLRPIAHRAGMTPLEIVRGFAKHPLVMTLTADQTLSPNFFTNISIDYALDRPNRIIMRRYGILDNTLTSAVASHAAFLDSKNTVNSPLAITPGVIYKRTSLLRPPKTELTAFSQTAYTMSVIPPTKRPLARGLSAPRITWTRFFAVVIALSILTYAGFALTAPDRLLLLGLIVGVYVFMYTTSLIGLKAYTFVDKISLVLLSPIFMVYRLLSYVESIILALVRTPLRIYNVARNLLPRKKYS